MGIWAEESQKGQDKVDDSSDFDSKGKSAVCLLLKDYRGLSITSWNTQPEGQRIAATCVMSIL